MIVCSILEVQPEFIDAAVLKELCKIFGVHIGSQSRKAIVSRTIEHAPDNG